MKDWAQKNPAAMQGHGKVEKKAMSHPLMMNVQLQREMKNVVKELVGADLSCHGNAPPASAG